MSDLQTITLNAPTSHIRHETLEGREYLVAPMVMLTEGVHAGSGGPLYYPAEELAKTPAVWNHKPVVVYHPTINGQGVSACEPAVIESRKIGMILNTRWDAGKLRAEAWLEKSRIGKVDPRVLNAIERNQMLELSTGLFTDNDPVSGKWKNEPYSYVARNYRPDHLAILPDQKGACSIEKGAGFLRFNSDADSQFVENLTEEVSQKLFNFMDSEKLTEKELVRNNVRDAVSKSYNAATLNAEARMKKSERIDRLIANAQTKWRESDRSFLQLLTDEQLEGAESVKDDPTETPDNRQVKDRPDTPQKAGAEKPAATPQQESQGDSKAADKPANNVSWSELYAKAPPEMQEVIANGVEMYHQEKQRLVDAVTANSRNVFTKEQLLEMKMPELRAVAALAQPQAAPPLAAPSFLGAATPAAPVANVHKQAPLSLPKYDFTKAKSA